MIEKDIYSLQKHYVIGLVELHRWRRCIEFEHKLDGWMDEISFDNNTSYLAFLGFCCIQQRCKEKRTPGVFITHRDGILSFNVSKISVEKYFKQKCYFLSMILWFSFFSLNFFALLAKISLELMCFGWSFSIVYRLTSRQFRLKMLFNYVNMKKKYANL